MSETAHAACERPCRRMKRCHSPTWLGLGLGLPAQGEKSGRHARSRAADSRLRVPPSPWDMRQGSGRTKLSSTPTTTHYYYPLLLAYYYHPIVEHAYYYPPRASTTGGRARPTTTTTHYYYYPLLPTQLSRHEVTSRVMSKENCMSEIRLPCTSSMHIVWLGLRLG